MKRIDKLRKQAEARGLTVVDRGNGHWQIKGGPLLVNFYPFAKKGPTLYINGMHKGMPVSSDEKVVDAAFNPPPKGYKSKRSSNRARNMRKRLMKKDPRCHWCGKELEYSEETLDHVIPLSRGGADRFENVVLSCKPCNSDRGNDMPELKEV